MWGNKYIPKYDKNAVLKFHSLAFYTSLQNEQKDTSNVIWILELPLDSSHWSKRVRWAGEAVSLNGKKEQGNIVTLKLQDFGCSALIAWMLFFVKSFFVRHSFISKMLTKLRPQEQARKLETFTHSKALKNNPFLFSGEKCRELQQCTSPCWGYPGLCRWEKGQNHTSRMWAMSTSLSMCYYLTIIDFRFLTANSKSCWSTGPLGWESYSSLIFFLSFGPILVPDPSVCMAHHKFTSIMPCYSILG